MALNEMTDARYIGKVCVHHPEFEGLRLKRSYACVQCNSEDKMRVSRGTLSKPITRESKIHALQKEWDKHNIAMRSIQKELEALMDDGGQEEGQEGGT